MVASWVVVVLPGGGYGAVGAVLRFPVLVLQAAGADATVVVEYPARSKPSEELLWPELVAAVDAQVRSAVSRAERVTFVAKSLGTAALARLDAQTVVGAQIDAVWLTPLLRSPEVQAGVVAKRAWRSLLVAGDADPYHDPVQHEATRVTLGCQSLVLPGADHFLEVSGDPAASVDCLRHLTEAVTGFVA